MRRGATLAVLAAALLATPSAAHDFWIEPSSFRPEVGSTVALRLFVGPNFQGEPFPRVPALLSKFVLASSSGQRSIPGRSGEDPAGSIVISEPGLQLVGYRSLDYAVSIDAAKFEQYLREEGLEKIAKTRQKRGETGKSAREAFSRCAKALLDAGAVGKTGFDRSLGFRLELLPEKNPYATRPGEKLPVRLLLDGRPLSGSLVQALLHGDPAAKAAARTGSDGRAKLPLSRPGLWMIKAVEMSQSPPGVDADWQSLWASLTFELPGANPVGKAP